MTVGELRKALRRRPAEMAVVIAVGPRERDRATAAIWSVREEAAVPRSCVGKRLVLCARSATGD